MQKPISTIFRPYYQVKHGILSSVTLIQVPARAFRMEAQTPQTPKSGITHSSGSEGTIPENIGVPEPLETPVLPEQVEPEKEASNLEKAIQLRDKLEALIRRTAQTKKKCEKLEHDNKYLQEYVGNLMHSGEFLSRRL